MSGSHLGFTMIQNILNCVVIKAKGVYQVSDRFDNRKRAKSGGTAVSPPRRVKKSGTALPSFLRSSLGHFRSPITEFSETKQALYEHSTFKISFNWNQYFKN